MLRTGYPQEIKKQNRVQKRIFSIEKQLEEFRESFAKLVKNDLLNAKNAYSERLRNFSSQSNPGADTNLHTTEQDLIE